MLSNARQRVMGLNPKEIKILYLAIVSFVLLIKTFSLAARHGLLS